MRHPAKFPDAILSEIDRMLGDAVSVLDPFAGTGRIHKLRPKRTTVGIEIELEWASMSPYTLVGNALNLRQFLEQPFDAIATSPTYGNRMADHHEAKDPSRRNTYRHTLGRPLDPDNSGSLQWGPGYREFHRRAWEEALTVLKPGGRFVLNIKDHIRGGRQQFVSEWHIQTLEELGLTWRATTSIPVAGNRFGANAGLRVKYESVILFKARYGDR